MTKDYKDKEQRKELKHCSHYYEYSHQEQEQISSTGANMRTLDVVVCIKCGNVKRQPTHTTNLDTHRV